MRPLLLALVFATIGSAQTIREEPVTFDSVDGVALAGTVSIPDGDGPFPGVVLVSGSGLQDRDGGPDSPLLPAGYRMYRDLAHGLTERGIVVLRYDERGAGESTAGPNPEAVTTLDYADDAKAAARTLAARPDVRWVGIVGHSEGGTVAPLAATAEAAVDGVVMVGASGVSGREIVLEQNRTGLAGAGVSEEATTAFLTRIDSTFALLAATVGRDLDDETREAVEQGLTDAFGGLPEAEAAKIGMTPALVPTVVAQQMRPVGSAWYRTFLALDPAEPVAALRVPALALYFALDQQVSPALNAGPMREALAASESPDWEVVTIDGVNHVFQRAVTGAVSEYATLDAALDPDVPDAIAAWILSVASR
ncbi:MAG: alpha/beta fold hydrolase [Bacteroidota bacterium]